MLCVYFGFDLISFQFVLLFLPDALSLIPSYLWLFPFLSFCSFQYLGWLFLPSCYFFWLCSVLCLWENSHRVNSFFFDIKILVTREVLWGQSKKKKKPKLTWGALLGFSVGETCIGNRCPLRHRCLMLWKKLGLSFIRTTKQLFSPL